MASNAGKAEQKLVVLLSRIAESELIDMGEILSTLFKVDESLISYFARGFRFHMLARTFHPVERFARIDSVTGIESCRSRVVSEGHQGPAGDSGPLVMFHRSLHEVLSDVETLMCGRNE